MINTTPSPDPVARHLAWCEHRELSPGTIRGRASTLRRLRAYLNTHHGVELLAATPAALEAWQLSLTCGEAGRRTLVLHARAFYRWAADRDLAEPRLIRELVVPRVPPRLPRPIPPADLARALATAPRRIRPWLLLAALAGLRACEIATLRAEDLDLANHSAYIRGKGRQERVIALGTGLVGLLEELRLPRRGWLFPALHPRGPQRGEPMPGIHVSPGQVSHIASAFLRDTGTTSLHTLRHRCATDLYRESLDLMLVRDYLGHSTTQVTEVYAKVAAHRERQAVELVVDRAIEALDLAA